MLSTLGGRQVDAQDQIRRLRRDIRIMQEAAEIRNRELDALHMVWCDGGCQRGVHRWADEAASPQELSALADIGQRNVDRLRKKARTLEWRARRSSPT